jgi:uncharacterized protein
MATESLDGFRAIVIQGARQVGKSTLAGMVAQSRGARVVTLDNEEDRRAAIEDPATFLDAIGTPAVIDEIQRAGDRLVLSIKQRLDADNSRGQYILTGSTNFLTAPTISETLAGRIDLITLWPCSIGELTGGSDGLVDRAFEGVEALLAHLGDTPGRSDYFRYLTRGGYPEVQDMPDRTRSRWFERYLETVLRREVETATDLRRFDALVAMAQLLMANTGQELVISSVADSVGIDRATAQAYQPWLESTFLLHRVPAWGRKSASRVVRRPKIHACDTGLASAILGKDAQALARPQDPMTGPLLESFAVAEIAKQLTWANTRARLYQLRERNGLEVDCIVEAYDGRLVALEVKASTVARREDAAPMATLRDRMDALDGRFAAGIVFHTGDRRVSLGDRLVGLPLADLWTG